MQVSNALREAQITLDVLFPPDLFRKAELPRTDHDQAFYDGVPRRSDVTAGSLGLQALAHQSGGQLLIGSKNYSDGIAACMDDAESYYELAFNFVPAAQSGEFHSLVVKVDRPQSTVRTRTMYYAEQ